MAFDDISKSLSEFTSDVTEKVTNTVKNPIKTMKEATDHVGKKVLGPRLDIIDDAHSKLRIEAMNDTFKSAVRSWAAAARRNKVTTTKVSAMTKAMNSFDAGDESAESVYNNYKAFLNEVVAEVKKGYYIGELENNAPKKIKKFSLNKTESPHMLEVTKDFEEKFLEEAASIRKDIDSAITVDIKDAANMNDAYKTESKKLDKTHDESMDASIELLSAWRKFSRIIRHCEKNVASIKKMEAAERRATAADKKKYEAKIKDLHDATKTLLNKDGAKALDAVAKAEEAIEKGYADISATLQSYVDTYGKTKTAYQAWIGANRNQTATVAKTMKNNMKTNSAAHTALIKKEKAITSTIDKAFKKPFTDTPGVTKAIAAFDKNYNDHQDNHLQKAVYTSTEAMHNKKDANLKLVMLEMFHNYIYNEMLLLRKNNVFLGFANRYHTSHAKYAKDAWDKIIDLKRSDSVLFKSYVAMMQKKAEYYNSFIKTNNKTIADQKTQVSAFRSMQWDVITLQKLFVKEGELIATQEEATITADHYTLLKDEVKRLSQHFKMMKRYSGEIEGAIKKSDTVIKDKEKSLTVKSTSALKKELEDLHKQKHEQEAVHNAYTHYMEELEGHIQELKDLLEGYAKKAKGAKKNASSQQKEIKVLTRKTAKSTTMKELNV